MGGLGEDTLGLAYSRNGVPIRLPYERWSHTKQGSVSYRARA